PLMATLAVVLNQSWALKLNIWLAVPLVKWTTIVPSPPPLAEAASTARELYARGFARVSVPEAGYVSPSINALAPTYGPSWKVVAPSDWLVMRPCCGGPSVQR